MDIVEGGDKQLHLSDLGVGSVFKMLTDTPSYSVYFLCTNHVVDLTTGQVYPLVDWQDWPDNEVKLYPDAALVLEGYKYDY